MQTAADSTRPGTAAPLNLSDAASALAAKLEGWAEALVLLLPNLVVAVLVVAGGAVAARLVRRVVTGVMHRVTQHAPQARNAVDLLATLAYVVVLATAVFFALRVVGLDGFVTTLLAGAGIVGLALGFAFQDIASNFIAGVLMAVRNPFVVGQIIETNSFTGTVREITLRSTVLDTPTGQRVILPNAKVFGDAIVNHSSLGMRRVDIEVGVGYDADLDAAEHVAVEAVAALPVRVAAGRAVQCFYTGFGESSVHLVVRFWIRFETQPDFFSAQSAAVKAIRQAFDAHGIQIPFPIRTIDFGPLENLLGGRGSSEAGPDEAGPRDARSGAQV